MAVLSNYYNRVFQVLIGRGCIQRDFSNFLKSSFSIHARKVGATWGVSQTRSILTSVEHCSQKKLEKTAFQVTKVVGEDGVVEKKTKLFVPKITLFTPENDMQVISIEEAMKLAKRRNLKLVLVTEKDLKTERAVYKLMSTADYVKDHQASKGKNSTAKNEKLISMTSKIAEHDLQAKINHIQKWLAKEHSVRVIITGGSENLKAAELVFDSISDGVSSAGRIVQKVSKHGEIKFQILPPKKPKTPKNEDPEENIEKIV